MGTQTKNHYVNRNVVPAQGGSSHWRNAPVSSGLNIVENQF